MLPIEIGTRADLHTCDRAIRKRKNGPPDGKLGWSLSEVCHIPGSSFMSHRVKLCKSTVRAI